MTGPDDRGQVAARLRAAGCVFADDEAGLILAQARSPRELESLVSQRVSGVPLEHVLGWAQFCGLRVAVDPGVFVPRRRSELLAYETVAAARRAGDHPVVLELCCGAGAIAAVTVAAVPYAVVHAVDVDPAAVRCARRNLPGATVHQGDLCDPLPTSLRGRVDVLVANAPYVPAADLPLLPPEARDHEPRTALDGGADGTAVQRRVVRTAPYWLSPHGRVLIETSERQAPQLVAVFQEAGLVARTVRSPAMEATVVAAAAPCSPSR